MPELTQDLLKELLHYDPETGIITWNVRDAKWFSTERNCKWWNSRFAETNAGNVSFYRKKLYIRIRMLRKLYMAHRLIWLYMTGEWPNQIDHINGDGLDNRWCNLRNVSQQENLKNQRKQSNNKSGINGVFWNKLNKKWQAGIGSPGCVGYKYLGLFSELKDAVESRHKAELERGYHPNHGEDRQLC